MIEAVGGERIAHFKGSDLVIDRSGDGVVRRAGGWLGRFFRGQAQELIFTGGEIAFVIEIANHEFGGGEHIVFQVHRAKLPHEVIGESGGFREEILEGRTFYIFNFAGAAVTRVEVFLEERTKINLFERVLGFGRCGGFFGGGGGGVAVALFFFGGDVVDEGNVFVQFFEDRVLNHLLVDHFLELHLVERKDADHLHQTRGEDLFLRDLEIESWLEKNHTCLGPYNLTRLAGFPAVWAEPASAERVWNGREEPPNSKPHCRVYFAHKLLWSAITEELVDEMQATWVIIAPRNRLFPGTAAMLHFRAKLSDRQNLYLAYGVAITSVALATLLSLPLRELFLHSRGLLLFVAIMFSAWYGGMKPGILASVLAAASFSVFFNDQH